MYKFNLTLDLSELSKNFKDIEKEFSEKIEKELNICRDDTLGDFIKSDYNCVGDSYRSPWSNKYFPITEIPHYPPSELRQLEIYFNKIFKEYAKLYYGDKSVSSVYVWEQGESIEQGFSCALLVKNRPNDENPNTEWDISSLVKVKFFKEKDEERLKTNYFITTSVIYRINISNFEFSGSMNRVNEESHYIKSHLDYETHIEKIGKLVEYTECNLRNSIDEIYIKKTMEVFKINSRYFQKQELLMSQLFQPQRKLLLIQESIQQTIFLDYLIDI